MAAAASAFRVTLFLKVQRQGVGALQGRKRQKTVPGDQHSLAFWVDLTAMLVAFHAAYMFKCISHTELWRPGSLVKVVARRQSQSS